MFAHGARRVSDGPISTSLLSLARAADAERIAPTAIDMLAIWSLLDPRPRRLPSCWRRSRTLASKKSDRDMVFRGQSERLIGRGRVAANPGPTFDGTADLDAIQPTHAPVRREGERIFGRGASDTGALAAMVEQQGSFAKSGFRVGVMYWIILYGTT